MRLHICFMQTCLIQVEMSKQCLQTSNCQKIMRNKLMSTSIYMNHLYNSPFFTHCSNPPPAQHVPDKALGPAPWLATSFFEGTRAARFQLPPAKSDELLVGGTETTTSAPKRSQRLRDRMNRWARHQGVPSAEKRDTEKDDRGEKSTLGVPGPNPKKRRRIKVIKKQKK